MWKQRDMVGYVGPWLVTVAEMEANADIIAVEVEGTGWGRGCEEWRTSLCLLLLPVLPALWHPAACWLGSLLSLSQAEGRTGSWCLHSTSFIRLLMPCWSRSQGLGARCEV